MVRFARRAVPHHRSVKARERGTDNSIETHPERNGSRMEGRVEDAAPMWSSQCPFCEREVLVYEEPPRCPLCGCPLDEERMHLYVWPQQKRTPPRGYG